MKKNDILKSFVKESGSMLLIVKKNNFKYYLSIILVVLSVILSLRLLFVFGFPESPMNQKQFFIWLTVTYLLPYFLLYSEYYKSQKEQFLILNYNGTIGEFSFWLKKANRTQVKIILIDELAIVSVISKGEDEIILLSNGKLPWGNRKIVLSDEFKDRKEEVLEFLKLIFLKG
jgi:hypothetical protein